MNYRATPRFWDCYNALPKEVRALADRCFAQLKADPSHRSLHLKKVGRLWSARVGLHHRVLATEAGERLVWFWIGTHADYDRLLNKPPTTHGLPKATASRAKERTRAKSSQKNR